MKPLIPKIEPKPSTLKKEFLGGAVKYLLNCKPSGLAIALFALTGLQSRAQTIYTPYAFTNFAGTPGVLSYANSGGAFNKPYGVAVDKSGNIFVADTFDQIIRKIDTAGEVTTLAGKLDLAGSVDGQGAAAQFSDPVGIAIDSAGNLYVADEGSFAIRKIDTAANVTTLAGQLGVKGSANGQGAAAQFYYPNGVAVDSAGNVYVSDTYNQTIRKIDTAANVTTLAGTNGVTGSADGQGSAAQFFYPMDLGVDSAGNLYVADQDNQTIRKIDTGGNVTTLAGQVGVIGGNDGQGTAAQFFYPYGLAVDSAGNIYVADDYNDTIRKIDTAANVTTLAGFPELPGSADGNGMAAEFNNPKGVAVDSAGNIYVGDELNDTVRKLDTAGNVTTVAGTVGKAGPGALLSGPFGVAVDSAGNLYVADRYNEAIRKIDSTGFTTTLAGDVGVQGSADGQGSAAQFHYPYGVALDSAGNVYISDTYSHTIRKIDTATNVTTVAGSPGVLGFVDAQGGAARFDYPIGLAVDSAGNLYVADEGNQAIRKIDTAGNVTTLAGNGVIGSADGHGSAAQFYYPSGVALDSAGNLYVGDQYNCTIRKIDTAANVTTVAGTAGVIGSADGHGAAAQFHYTSGVAVDKAGNVYVTDEDNYTIRRVDTAGNVTTLAGNPGVNGTADGIGRAAGFYIPYALAVDNAGNIYVADSQNSRISKGTSVLFLTVKQSATALTLSWIGDGTLQSSTNVAGPYIDVPGSSNPYTVTPSGPQQYYRARR